MREKSDAEAEASGGSTGRHGGAGLFQCFRNGDSDGEMEASRVGRASRPYPLTFTSGLPTTFACPDCERERPRD